MTSTLRVWLRRSALAIVALFVAIQFIPVDRSNPPVTREVRWDSETTRALAVRACYACHSNQTDWPWYAYVAPASWKVAGHVDHGRGHVNFSEWDEPNEDLEEFIEVLEDHEMPLNDYLLLHPEARLTAEERAQLIAGIEATFAADPPLERPRRGRPPADSSVDSD